MNGPDALEMRRPLLSRKQTSIGRRRKVGFLDLIPKSLRTNQAHRSGGGKRQRFNHPPPAGLSGRTRGSKSDLDARSRNVCLPQRTDIINSSSYVRKVPIAAVG